MVTSQAAQPSIKNNFWINCTAANAASDRPVSCTYTVKSKLAVGFPAPATTIMGRRIETEPRPMTLSKEFVSDSSDEEVDGPFTSPPQTKKASAAHEQQQQDHAENSDVGDSSEIVTAAATSSDESSSEKENGNEVASRSKKQIKPRSRKKAPPNPPQKSV